MRAALSSALMMTANSRSSRSRCSTTYVDHFGAGRDSTWCSACEDGGTNRRWTMPTRTSQETAKKAKATASSGKANALQRPLQPSEALAAVVGPGPLSRGEVLSKVWDYIKSHNL